MRETWKHISEVTEDTINYIEQRRQGNLKSLRTGYQKLDDSGIDGFEWGTTISIGGRPGVGKSAFSDCLIRGCFDPSLNEQNFDLLDFNWEMTSRTLLLRNLSSDMMRSYKHIVSADKNKITDEEMKFLEDRLRDHYAKMPIYYVEKPETPKEFADTVRSFRDKASRKGRKLLVRVDHTILGKTEKDTPDTTAMLYSLLGLSNEIKKEDSTTTFMFLSQLLRKLEERQEDNSTKSFPIQADAFGADAVAMFSESIIMLNKPSKYGITYYGKRPNGIQVNPWDLFAHITKNRNAAPDLIIRFTERFSEMRMEEL